MKKKKGILGMAIAFLLNNLLAVVMCLLIMTLFSFVLDTSFGWILYVLMLVLYAFFLYHQAWQYGSRDLDNGFEKRTSVALYGGILAAIPTTVMAIFSFLIDAGLYAPNFNMAGQAFAIIAYRFWNMPFRIIFEYLEVLPVLYFVPCITMPLFVTVGYIFGYKQIKISDYIYYAREKNE